MPQADTYHEGLSAIFAFLANYPMLRAYERKSRRLFACIRTRPIW